MPEDIGKEPSPKALRIAYFTTLLVAGDMAGTDQRRLQECVDIARQIYQLSVASVDGVKE